ncbi:MAG: hypothetical protein LWW94_10335 [Candidatus Desulfofervidaceae bacterium]|nr:hypothetical protein [Candidatus Desulfofervidaceae bacterium]
MSNKNLSIYGILSIISICFFVFLSSKVGYPQQNVSKLTMEFAQKSLQNYLKNVINEQNFANFGFKTLREVKFARLGAPYPVVIIGLKSLKTYTPKTGAKALLIDAKTLWFPVIVRNEIRTKLEIIKKDDKLIPGEFGGIRNVKPIVQVRNNLSHLLATKGIEAPHKVALLKIPALYATFLYIEDSKGEFLVPAMVQPQRYNLENGKMYTADEVLSQLKVFAKEIGEREIR